MTSFTTFNDFDVSEDSSDALSDDGCDDSTLSSSSFTTFTSDTPTATTCTTTKKNHTKTKTAITSHRSFRDHPPINLLVAGTRSLNTTAQSINFAARMDTTIRAASPNTKAEMIVYLVDRCTKTVARLSKPSGYYDSGFEEEYSALVAHEMTTTTPVFVAQSKETKRRNRYANIIPLAATIVTLQPTPVSGTNTNTAATNDLTATATTDATTTTSSYINANYVNDELIGSVASNEAVTTTTNSTTTTTTTAPPPHHPPSFIACQAPKLQYINEFWIMIWDENVPAIAMMTKCQEGNKKKAFPYWDLPPDEKNKATVQVTVASVEQSNDNTVVRRRIELSRNNEVRHVQHVQFLGWPDFSVPKTYQPLAVVLTETEHYSRSISQLKGPTVVHCSAGIGRAMTAISCLITVRKIQACFAEKTGPLLVPLGTESTSIEIESTDTQETKDEHAKMSSKEIKSSRDPWWVKYGCVYDPLDVQGTVERVRQQRHGAVVNAEQYEFIHRFVLDWLSNVKH